MRCTHDGFQTAVAPAARHPEDHVTRRLLHCAFIVMAVVLAAGCAASQAFRNGNASMKAGDLDQAVAYYRTASQASPDNPNYKIALQRALLAASRAHFDRAREFEEKDQLEAARGEYQLALEYDSSNRQAAAKVAALDQTIRARIEAARPRPPIEQLRERARAATAEPLLNPTSRDPLRMTFNNINIRDVLTALGGAAGVSLIYDPTVPTTPISANIDGVTFEQAMQQIMTVNSLAYKVQSERSILVFPDTAQKHAQYDEQVLQTFYVSNADVTELTQLLTSLVRLPTLPVQPTIQFNKTANTITVRAPASIVQIIGRIIEQNDKARAEIMFDIEILEVNRNRAKAYGLNLSEYAIGLILSPEVSPGATQITSGTTTTGTGTQTTVTAGKSTPPSGVTSPPPFNLNTISRGFTTSDFYVAVPTAIVRFLESDTQTKLVAKPQIRSAEGNKTTVNLGDQVPIVTTSYTPIATGGAGVNPLNSFQLKDVGINVDITPVRVTLEGDIVIDLTLESSTRGPDVNIAGTNYPSFGQRKVSTRLRLRDGESNLLAGLLREDERKALAGVPGAIRVPILKQLFSSNDQTIAQTDIVMLLTPHIVRAPEITETDLKPLYIGTQNSLGIGGPPPLIAGPADNPPQGVGVQPPPPAPPILQVPPGSSPVPGFVVTPAPPEPPPPPPPPPPGAAATPTPVVPPPAANPNPPDVPPASAGIGQAQVLVTPPATPFRVGGGPYNVPITITNASRISGVTVALTYDPALLRPRTVTEGGFMRSGGYSATFNSQIGNGRVDIVIIRAADSTGATGTGLLGAVMFDAIGQGTSTIGLSGTATGPGGTAMGLVFRPVTVTIQP
jgi:general secretion pathway protein D